MKDLSLKMISVLITILLVSLGSLTVMAQSNNPGNDKSILSFEEGDRDKKTAISIDADGRSRPIIDINSQLTIHIDKEQVLQEAAKYFDTGASEKAMDALSEIRGILEMEDKLLNLIGLDLKDDVQARRAKLRFFSKNMGKLFDFIMATKIASTKRDALEAWNKTKDEKERYQKVMAIVRRDVDVYFGKLKKSLDESSVVFRLGGWLISNGKETPIHIEGFDRYEKFEYHQYPFFTKPTTEEFVNGIRDLKERATNINNGQRAIIIDINVNFKKIFQELKESLDSIFQCMKDSFNQILKEPEILNLKDQIPEVEELLDNTGELLDSLDDLKKELDSINDEVNNLKESPGELENHFLLIDSLEKFIEERDLKTELANIKKDIEDITGKLKVVITTKPDLKPVIDKILEKIKQDNCIQKIEDIIKDNAKFLTDLWDKIKSIINGLKPVKEQYELNLGDKVDSILIDNIPPNGMVDLKFSGPREEGDEIAFVAVLEKRSADGTEIVKSVTITRQFMMMFKLLKLEMNLGLIFANPLTKEADYMDKGITLTKSFQAAPSYSILFKPGSRKSIFYNKYLRFGIGLNVSALDFNQDSTYELGLGLVLSGFKDYVQLGVGRNMEIDSWYWFFGLSLPFGEITLPTGTTGGLVR